LKKVHRLSERRLRRLKRIAAEGASTRLKLRCRTQIHRKPYQIEDIVSPMVGTFYCSASPDSPPISLMSVNTVTEDTWFASLKR